jgi:phosphoserine aminotransferase
MKMIPTMCNWVKFQEAPNKIYNVPVLFSVWLGAMVCEWMIEKGGIPYFEKLAIERSGLLYDLIDGSSGFYRTFVTDPKFRSRMQIVFTVRTGTEVGDVALVEEFLRECNDDLGWLDIRSHPLGLGCDVIRVTMYNHQTIDTATVVRDYMRAFMQKHTGV